MADHPRSRGVYLRGLYQYKSESGSSPLARGLLRFRLRLSATHGIIPARAGFTLGRPIPLPLGRDHPRSRGVYWVYDQKMMQYLGSSPLARGLRWCSLLTGINVRIIPARAGFTRARRAGCSAHPDHPRSRGVYMRLAWADVSPSGSSPLARGLRRRRRSQDPDGWIIPARAGFTALVSAALRPGADHPRSRGVYGVRTALWARIAGSSPLARGLHEGDPPVDLEVGIIPARAGFTPSSRSTSSSPRDHPRSRGVYVGTAGLSP